MAHHTQTAQQESPAQAQALQPLPDQQNLLAGEGSTCCGGGSCGV